MLPCDSAPGTAEAPYGWWVFGCGGIVLANGWLARLASSDLVALIVVPIIEGGMNIIHHVMSDLSQRLVLPLQGLHFAVERSPQVVRGAPEFGKCLTDSPPQFWKLLGPKQNEGDEEDNQHLLDAKRYPLHALLGP